MQNIFETAIVIGVGFLENNPLPNAKSIHVVDATSESINHFKEAFADYSNIKFHNVLIADKEENYNFRLFNLNEFNSISKPTKLLDLYPKLKIIEEKSIQAQSLQCFIESLNLTTNNNLLVIDLPGYSAKLLKSFVADEVINHFFKDVICCVPEQPLYEDDLALNKLEESIAHGGFDLKDKKKINLEKTQLTILKNSGYAKLKEIIAALESKITEQAVFSDSQASQIDDYKSQLNVQNQLVAELTTSQQQTDSQLIELEKSKQLLQERLEQTQSEKGQVAKLLSEKTSESDKKIETLQCELDTNSSQLEELKIIQQQIELQNTELEQHKQVAQESLQQIQLEKADLESKYAEQVALVKDQAEKILTLQEKLTEQDKWLEEHEKWNQGLKSENETKAEKISELDEQLSEKIALAADLTNQVNELNGQLDSQSQQINELKNVQQQAELQKQELEQSQQELLHSVDQVASEKEEIVSKLAEQTTMFEEQTTRVLSLEEKLLEQENWLAEHDKWNQSLKLENESHSAKITELEQNEQELLANVEKLELTKAEINEQLTEKKLLSNNQANQIIELNNQLESQAQTLDELQNSQQQSAMQKEELESKYAEKTKLFEEHAKLVLGLEEKITEKDKWLEEHDRWNQGLKLENENNTLKITELEDSLSKQSDQLSVIEKEREQLKKELNEQVYRNQRLDQEALKLEAQLELIKDVILREKAF